MTRKWFTFVAATLGCVTIVSLSYPILQVANRAYAQKQPTLAPKASDRWCPSAAVGRYQLVVAPSPGRPEVAWLLDTTTGQVWWYNGADWIEARKPDEPKVARAPGAYLPHCYSDGTPPYSDADSDDTPPQSPAPLSPRRYPDAGSPYAPAVPPAVPR